MFKKEGNLFNVLFEAASEGIIVVDENHRMIAVNTALSRMFGYDPHELKGEPLNTLIPVYYEAAHTKDVSNFIKKGEKRRMGHGRDIFGLKKDGTQFPVEAGLNPFEWEGKRYVMSLIIDVSIRLENQRQIKELNSTLEERIKSRTSQLEENVTKLRKANLNLEQEIKRRKTAEHKMKDALVKEKELSELKSKFLSMVSHEFKTPLSGILTSTILAGKYKLEEQQEKREKHFNIIKSKVQYLDNILNDFLSIERLESGRVKYNFTDFSLQKLINEVVYNANVTLKNGQEILCPKNLEDLTLHQDEKILELVLSNLLNNAIKYSSEGTTIFFDIEVGHKVIVFTVKDQGIGIPQKDQKYIFERYFRAGNAVLTQGTGIGLNTAKEHLEKLGGSIRFQSEELKGTTFIVELPIVKE